jgi:hypothetical protein
VGGAGLRGVCWPVELGRLAGEVGAPAWLWGHTATGGAEERWRGRRRRYQGTRRGWRRGREEAATRGGRWGTAAEGGSGHWKEHGAKPEPTSESEVASPTWKEKDTPAAEALATAWEMAEGRRRRR